MPISNANSASLLKFAHF